MTVKLDDFSQLPVMQGDRNVYGLISWKSIGKGRISDGNPCTHVRDCMDKVEEVTSDTHLFDAVKIIAEKEVVLVRGSENKIVGLVTTADISGQFVSLSEPFLLLSEIENHVRRLIDAIFTLEELRAVRDPGDSNRKIENVANLTFGEYVRLLDNPANWEKLNFRLTRSEFTKRLREIGRIRNDVMHFHPDGISPEDIDLLREGRKSLNTMVGQRREAKD